MTVRYVCICMHGVVGFGFGLGGTCCRTQLDGQCIQGTQLFKSEYIMSTQSFPGCESSPVISKIKNQSDEISRTGREIHESQGV